jgi:hypothetical protein
MTEGDDGPVGGNVNSLTEVILLCPESCAGHYWDDRRSQSSVGSYCALSDATYAVSFYDLSTAKIT